jgi:hypothetical protein
MGRDRTNYFAWAVVVMLVITAGSMLDTWYSSMSTKKSNGQETAQIVRPAYTVTRLKVPPPGTTISSAAAPDEHDEHARRALDSTAVMLQTECWKYAGGDLNRQSKARSCLDYHAYVNFGIMPLAPIRAATRP